MSYKRASIDHNYIWYPGDEEKLLYLNFDLKHFTQFLTPSLETGWIYILIF